MGKDLKGKELGKGILQRKNGKYQARFVNRFGKREDVYGNTLKEVKNKLAQRQKEDAEMKNVINPKTTLDEWYEQWMNVYKIPSIRPTTQRNYSDMYRVHISPVLGKRRISEITKLQVTSLLNRVAQEGYKYGTLVKIRSVLRDMYDRAVEDEYVSKNPMLGVRLPLQKPKNEVKSLSMEEQKLFMEYAAGTFYYNLFVVALNTGLRPGELFALTEKDIDFKNKKISVSKTLVYQNVDGDTSKMFHIHPPKTEHGYRDVPINLQCEQALRRQIKQKRIISNKVQLTGKKASLKKEFGDFIFTTMYATPLYVDVYNQAIEKIVKEINFLLDPLEQIEVFSGHTLRHTFATRCFEQGIPGKTVQTYMGHSSLKMTMDLYTDVLEDKMQEDIKRLDELNERLHEDKAFDSNIIRFGT